MNEPKGRDASAGLRRQLSLFDSVMIGTGIIIGSGIFMTTGIIAQHVQSTGLILLVWLLGGLLTLAGALTYAELSAAMPEAGGQYVYIREAYGNFWAFIFGWVLMLIYWSGGVAGIAAGFAEYFGYFFPALGTDSIIFSAHLPFFDYTLSAGQLVAVALIVLLSIANYLGVTFGKTIQNIVTCLKILALLGIIVWGLAVPVKHSFELTFMPQEGGFLSLMVGMGMAMIAVSWAFDGWNNLTVIAGEVVRPERNMVRALVLITVVVTVLYLLINVIYLRALPLQEIIGVNRIAEKATGALFGGSTAFALSLVVLVSTLGSVNGSIMVGPRIFYAMSRDGLFFRSLAVVNKRFRTPGNAIIAQCIWCSIVALSGTFEQIITFAMFTSLAFGIAASLSIFTLRRKRPDLPRPYRTWGYPVVPVLFIIASAGIMIATLIEAPVEAGVGIALAATGVPVYFFMMRKNRQV